MEQEDTDKCGKEDVSACPTCNHESQHKMNEDDNEDDDDGNYSDNVKYTCMYSN